VSGEIRGRLRLAEATTGAERRGLTAGALLGFSFTRLKRGNYHSLGRPQGEETHGNTWYTDMDTLESEDYPRDASDFSGPP
jgi:hypothetical protein